MENSTGQMYMKKWGKKNRWKENWMYKPNAMCRPYLN